MRCLLYLMCQDPSAFAMAATVRGLLLLRSRPWLLHAAEWPVSAEWHVSAEWAVFICVLAGACLLRPQALPCLLHRVALVGP